MARSKLLEKILLPALGVAMLATPSFAEVKGDGYQNGIHFNGGKGKVAEIAALKALDQNATIEGTKIGGQSFRYGRNKQIIGCSSASANEVDTINGVAVPAFSSKKGSGSFPDRVRKIDGLEGLTDKDIYGMSTTCNGVNDVFDIATAIGEYVFDYIPDGNPEKLVLHGQTTSIFGNDGKFLSEMPTDGVRALTMNNFGYGVDKAHPKGELMILDDKDVKEVLSYLVDSNNFAKDTRLNNTLQATGLLEKIAYKNVTSRFMIDNFLKSDENKTGYGIVENEVGRRTYENAFGQEVSPARVLLELFGITSVHWSKRDYELMHEKNEGLEAELVANNNLVTDKLNDAAGTASFAKAMFSGYKLDKDLFEAQIDISGKEARDYFKKL